MEVLAMKIEDYDEAWKIWVHTKGMGLNNLDDSREGIRKFLRRNPSTCFVAKNEGKVIGVILAGNDGRRGYIYHLAVKESERRKGVADRLLKTAMKALEKEGIKKIASLVYKENKIGNQFWEKEGFVLKEGMRYRSKAVAMQTMYSCGCMYHMGKPPASIGGEQEISNRGRGQSPSDKRSARMRRDSAAQLISPHMRLNLRLWISAICLIRVKLLCKQTCSGFLFLSDAWLNSYLQCTGSIKHTCKFFENII